MVAELGFPFVTDQLLLVSRIALLALVYLVFARVARAVMVEVRAEAKFSSGRRDPIEVPPLVTTGAPTPRPTPRSETSSSPGHRLVVISGGPMAGSSYWLQSEMTIGRALGCAVSIDDVRVSKLHARVFEIDGKWVIADLGSTNGTTVNDRQCTASRQLNPGDRIQIGEVVMEFE